jgi:uncharacterized protein YbjT (DUF2867 family)
MKIIITGSTGHISKPLTMELVQQGHEVTVISSNADKQAEISALGATAAIGSLRDVEFLTRTFMGADAVYTMVPPGRYMDHSFDLMEHYLTIGSNYAQAIRSAGVPKVVNLSTIGAGLSKGNGILSGAHNVELILNELPAEITLVHMRPNSFYYNLLSFIPMIRSAGVMAANYGADDIIPWVSPADIAVAVAEELTATFQGRKIRPVASEDLSGNDTAKILGEAIGIPDLTWQLISDQEMLAGMRSAGMNPRIAAGLVEMYAGLHSGLLAEDYNQNKPVAMGKVKMKDYAKEFAAAFKQ